MRLIPAVAIATTFFACCPLTFAELLDDFSAPILDEDKWLKVDLNDGREWGPGVFDTSTGALSMRTTGSVPPPNPFVLEESGYMAVGWKPSLADPLAYSDGTVRTKWRVDSDVAPSIEMRGDLGDWPEAANFTAYDFNAAPLSGTFNINLFEEGIGSRLGVVPGVKFSPGEDWWVEASTIGDQISMKVWQVGSAEPSSPQLTIRDSTLSQGGIALGAGLGFDNLVPVMQDAMFDDVSFFVPEPSSVVVLLLGIVPLVHVLRRVSLSESSRPCAV